MANHKHGNKLYNTDMKEMYLATFKESTAKQYRNILLKSYSTETSLNKDLNEFTIKEIVEMLKKDDVKDINSIANKSNLIKTYLKWSIKNGYSQNIGVLQSMKRKWYEEYFDIQQKDNYYSSKEISTIEDNCINFQDACVIRLLFEGVSGEKLSEVINLKINDVDFINNQLKIIDDKEGINTIDVSVRCIELIQKAYTETKYKKLKTGLRMPYNDLLETGHVIKNSITRTNVIEDRRGEVVYRRLKNLEKMMSIDLTPSKLVNSGMIHMANNLMEAKNSDEFDYEMYKEVALRFKFSDSAPSYKAYKFKFFNTKLIREVSSSMRDFSLITPLNTSDDTYAYDDIKEAIKKSLIKYVSESDRISANDYYNKKYLPSLTTIRVHFESFDKALEAAGIKKD